MLHVFGFGVWSNNFLKELIWGSFGFHFYRDWNFIILLESTASAKCLYCKTCSLLLKSCP